MKFNDLEKRYKAVKLQILKYIRTAKCSIDIPAGVDEVSRDHYEADEMFERSMVFVTLYNNVDISCMKDDINFSIHTTHNNFVKWYNKNYDKKLSFQGKQVSRMAYHFYDELLYLEYLFDINLTNAAKTYDNLTYIENEIIKHIHNNNGCATLEDTIMSIETSSNIVSSTISSLVDDKICKWEYKPNQAQNIIIIDEKYLK